MLLLCAHGAPLDVADAVSGDWGVAGTWGGVGDLGVAGADGGSVPPQHGQTPLMLAARGNHAAVCAQLLQSGADPDLTDGDKK